MILKKILMLSDTHFSANNSLLFAKYDVEQTFARLKNRIKNEQADVIILTGDISQDGSVESYLKMRECLNDFAGDKYYIMGNHDSKNIVHLNDKTISAPDYIDIGNHRFIFISSYKGDGYDEGHISATELNKIEKYALPIAKNYVVVHHHFIANESILDNWILDNSQEFCNRLQANPIQAVFHGHVHNGYTKKLGNINVYANPATCVQFALSKVLKIEPVIGYRVLNLTENSYETHVYHENF